ncbi:unnamed protein product [Prorocentrum cordatum]|uniref:Secreted protein n=1 Tax=Prorocentrum cordatum TaxID=2364126 RepID=A0ABN9P862_9DINO|nr:unnamed protein product [Polarella glacialis]
MLCFTFKSGSLHLARTSLGNRPDKRARGCCVSGARPRKCSFFLFTAEAIVYFISPCVHTRGQSTNKCARGCCVSGARPRKCSFFLFTAEAIVYFISPCVHPRGQSTR